MALVTCPTSSSSDPAFPASVSFLSALLCSISCAILIPAPPVSVPWAGWRHWGIHFLSVALWTKLCNTLGCFHLAWGREDGGVECWGLPRWKSAGIAVQWTKLRGKLEVPQNSVQIQLHTLKIGGGGRKKCLALSWGSYCVYCSMRRSENSTPGGWTLWLGKCVRVKSSLLGFSNPYVVIFFYVKKKNKLMSWSLSWLTSLHVRVFFKHIFRLKQLQGNSHESFGL